MDSHSLDGDGYMEVVVGATFKPGRKMTASFLKIALRKLYRERMYALINIAGLSIGIACCVMLGLYLQSELTYDKHHVNHDRIFRVVNEYTHAGSSDGLAVVPPVLGPMLVGEYPEVQDYVRFRHLQEIIYTYQDQSYEWDGTFIADDNVFDVFTHDILQGDPDTALDEPHTVAVSETFAKRYFGDQNPIGKIVKTDNGQSNTITLVFADLPENSHLRYDVLVSYNNPALALPENIKEREQRMRGTSDYTYLVMREGYDTADFKQVSDDFYARHMEPWTSLDNVSWSSWLQPLADIHLSPSGLVRDLPTGNRLYLYGLTAVAVFILLIACINYMNLATARFIRRSREVGMCKILGAGRAQLVLQFLAEAFAFALLSVILGVLLVEVAITLTPVSQLLDKQLMLDFSTRPGLGWWLLGLCLVVGLLAGAYPAFFLSSVAPLAALSAESRPGKTGVRMRELLVLVQFTISVGVIACTLLMVSQMQFIADKQLGFEHENRVVVRLRGADLLEKIPALRNELEKNSNILGIATSVSIMGDQFPTNGMPIENNEGESIVNNFEHMSVDGNFFEVMNLQVIRGRDFSRRLLTDVGNTFVVNEAMVEKMGWQQPLGKHIYMGGRPGQVIGVVKDFHYTSLHNKIGAFVMYPFNEDLSSIPANFRAFVRRDLVLNIAGDDIRNTLGYIENVMAEFDPGHPFEFEFLDTKLDGLYRTEQRLMKLTGIFAGICIFISCLGLFGLASYTTEQRTREIGIRKVLGATAAQIILLLSGNVLGLVIFGALIASLLSWYAIQEWLAGFAYSTGINPAVFLVSALAAAVVAYATMALQCYRTARANPVGALRYECWN